ncbi:hypothetical protein, unlikely [Trypanosoma brucei brucei TREU927]|uniref:Uncharacterized protein n=1 Tax=Trypanosoma brucei brucei (strain 927/4 GUTat10.1) TaxID=185431 RepID=Q4GYS1_TRYB2|nr:hypothetical protein, unlikely [Trypanosoma brucei brucei TREU927]CAJ16508.1 hypothetical protein, unlikely [Trypanosoma brucei brucei TREU927]
MTGHQDAEKRKPNRGTAPSRDLTQFRAHADCIILIPSLGGTFPVLTPLTSVTAGTAATVVVQPSASLCFT